MARGVEVVAELALRHADQQRRVGVGIADHVVERAVDERGDGAVDGEREPFEVLHLELHPVVGLQPHALVVEGVVLAVGPVRREQSELEFVLVQDVFRECFDVLPREGIDDERDDPLDDRELAREAAAVGAEGDGAELAEQDRNGEAIRLRFEVQHRLADVRSVDEANGEFAGARRGLGDGLAVPAVFGDFDSAIDRRSGFFAVLRHGQARLGRRRADGGRAVVPQEAGRCVTHRPPPGL